MANQWLRLWHDMPTDPKWRFIAKVSGRPIAEVQALFLHLLVRASAHHDRGHVPGLTCNNCHECHAPSRDIVTCHERSFIEALSIAIDTEIDHVKAILNAMQGRVMDGDWITGWDKRQPKKEDDGNPETGAKSAAERQRDRRARLKAEKQGNGESQGVTPCHDESHEVTTDKDEDKDKENKNTSPASPATAAAVREVFEFWKTKLRHPKAVFDGKRKRLIEARLKNFSVDDLKAAITGCSLSPFHMGKNDTGAKHDGIELIMRDAAHVEQFMKFNTASSQNDIPPTDWWRSPSGIEAKGKELGVDQEKYGGFIPFKLAVLKAAGPGPWSPQ